MQSPTYQQDQLFDDSCTWPRQLVLTNTQLDTWQSQSVLIQCPPNSQQQEVERRKTGSLVLEPRHLSKDSWVRSTWFCKESIKMCKTFKVTWNYSKRLSSSAAWSYSLHWQIYMTKLKENSELLTAKFAAINTAHKTWISCREQSFAL